MATREEKGIGVKTDSEINHEGIKSISEAEIKQILIETENAISPRLNTRNTRVRARAISRPSEVLAKLQTEIAVNIGKVFPPKEIDPRTIGLTCSYCGQTPDNYSFQGHRRRQNDSPIKSKGKDRFRCTSCKRSFSRTTSIEAHRALRATTILIAGDLIQGYSLRGCAKKYGLSVWQIRLSLECVITQIDVIKEKQLETFQKEDKVVLFIDKSGSGVSKRISLLSIADMCDTRLSN